MKSKALLGIFFFFTLIGSTVFGSFSENSRQGSEPIISITHQGVELLNPAPDLGSEDTDGKNCVRLNNHAKVLTPFLFQGRRWDGFSGQYWNRNRFYNPRYGRFSSSDPVSFDGGNNLYIYANNNPQAFADPFGLKYKLVSGDPKLFSDAEARLRESKLGNDVLTFLNDFPGMVEINLLPGEGAGGLLYGQTGVPKDVANGKRNYTSCDDKIPLNIYMGSHNVKVGLKWTWSVISYIAVELGHEGGHVKEPTKDENFIFDNIETPIVRELRKKGLLKK